MTQWKANEGAVAEIDLDVSAWISNEGRSFPRFIATNLKFHPMPAYMAIFNQEEDTAAFQGVEASADI